MTTGSELTVLVLGSANADLVVAVERRPAGGETVLGGDTVVMPGGKGANTAVAAGKLGARVALLGAVGEDGYGSVLRTSLESAGVRTDLLRTSARPTGIAYITVTPDGENSIVVAPGANSDVSPADVDASSAALRSAAVLVCSLETPLSTVEHAVAVAARAGVRPLLNLSPVAQLSSETLAQLDPLVVNEHEAAWLLGEPTAEVNGAEDGAEVDGAEVDGADLARRLLALGPRSVVVTLGARGAVVATPQGVHQIAAPTVHAVDTTGAGDAFAGALATRLGEGDDLVPAAEYAARVAAISVTRSGAQPSYPTAEEVDG
ncbi:ribokinase [Goodfellowiella coeruleoviolacea]|uniref:Ribokinase n=1 Tax=Goodfellowiella coeruleoviolacea TaxID=334858 RepID=A0AAE3KIX0_9PSEU|nr:ribokinase [Goodfellowiella coeruleoviolacea]MCP2168935.1 ribokinase [Goodfellowiella coeruleoviolacea]